MVVRYGGGYLGTATSQMSEAHHGALGPSDRKAWDRLVAGGTRHATDAIATWAATTKGLAATEASGVMTTGAVTVATWWFPWAKGLQGLPYLGGAGRPEPTCRTSAGG